MSRNPAMIQIGEVMLKAMLTMAATTATVNNSQQTRDNMIQ